MACVDAFGGQPALRIPYWIERRPASAPWRVESRTTVPLTFGAMKTAEPDGLAAVTRVFSIVTSLACTVIVPVTSSAEITVPGVVTVIGPDGVSRVPAGTPVFAGSG